jgi:HEAT repeat protein
MKSRFTTAGTWGILLLTAASLLAAGPKLDARQTRRTGGKQEPANLWGKTVNGAKAGLAAPLLLRLGQPLEATLSALPPSEKGPYVHVHWGEHGTVKLHMTDGQDQAVPFRLQMFEHSSSLSGDFTRFRLWPTDKHAQGRYWKPGIYHLWATIEHERNVLEPHIWYGKLVTNKVRLEAVEPSAPRVSLLEIKDVRDNVDAAIKDLDAVDAGKRMAAEKTLVAWGVCVLPVIEQTLPKASPEAAKSLLRIREAILIPFNTNSAPFDLAMGGFLAELDDVTWKALDQQFVGLMQMKYRLQRARYAPVLRLTEKELAALLQHAEADMRVRAIRSLPRTANKDTLAKLVACLKDPYQELRGFVDAYPVYPVSEEAREAIIWQGPSTIPLLLEWAARPGVDKKERAYRMQLTADILGKIGPADASEQFLHDMLQSQDEHDRWFALQAFVDWGHAAVPALVKIAQDEKELVPYRRIALETLGRVGTAKEVGDVLRKMLDPAVGDELTGAAITGIHRLKLLDVLPALKRIALSEDKVDQNTRYKAIDAVVGLADKKDAEKVLLALLAPQTHHPVRLHAMYRAAQGGYRAAVPQLIAALEDGKADVRQMAERALRVLANLPDGVPQESGTSNAVLWRRWWAKQK